MRLSFITSAYNGLPYTRDFLDSFKHNLPQNLSESDYEYVFVDDGSTDGTRLFLSGLPAPPFRVFYNEHNSGFAYSNNRAARIATGDYLVFLNNDLILTPDWLGPMLKAFEDIPGLGCAGNIQFNVGTGLIDHAGVFFDLEGRPAHARKHRKTPPSGNYLYWNAVTAACMIVPRRVFLELGGFDIAYRNGCEDIDLCVRIRQAGYTIAVANQSRIYHHVSSSHGRNDHNDANTEIFLSRHREISEQWGKNEWASEYLHRYARRFWKYNASKLSKAIYLTIQKQIRNQFL